MKNEKNEVKADAFARIRFYGPTEKDITDERPRVRRAALCALTTCGDESRAMRALDAAVTDKSEVVFLATARAAQRRYSSLQGVAIDDVLRSAVELRAEKSLDAVDPGQFAAVRAYLSALGLSESSEGTPPDPG